MSVPVLSDKDVYPSDEVVFSHLGGTAEIWKAFFDELRKEHPDFAEEWRYYNDGKSWLLKVIRKKKTVCWISVAEGTFRMTSYFTDKAEQAVAGSSLPDELKDRFLNGQRYGKLRAFTVTFESKKDIRYAREVIGLKLAMK